MSESDVATKKTPWATWIFLLLMSLASVYAVVNQAVSDSLKNESLSSPAMEQIRSREPIVEADEQDAMVVTEQDIATIKQMVTTHYGLSIGVVSIKKRETGIFEIIGTTSVGRQDESTIRHLYVTKDLQNLIEGTLYTENMGIADLRDTHNPVAKSRIIKENNDKLVLDKMKNEVESAILSGKPGEVGKLVTEAASKSAKGLQDSESKHIRTIAEHANISTVQNKQVFTPQAAPSTTPKPEMAQLPRGHVVAYKQGLLDRMSEASWIQEGTSNKIIYVFVDYLCPACKKMHKDIKEMVNAGKFTARYLPVGALGDQSKGLASLALIPDSNEEKLKLHKRFLDSELKDITYTQPEQDELYAAANRAVHNLQILVDTKKPVTPLFAFETDGGPVITTLTKHTILQAAESIKKPSAEPIKKPSR